MYQVTAVHLSRRSTVQRTLCGCIKMGTVLTLKMVPCSNRWCGEQAGARGLLQNKYSFKYSLNNCLLFLCLSFLLRCHLVFFLLAFSILFSLYLFYFLVSYYLLSSLTVFLSSLPTLIFCSLFFCHRTFATCTYVRCNVVSSLVYRFSWLWFCFVLILYQGHAVTVSWKRLRMSPFGKKIWA